MNHSDHDQQAGAQSSGPRFTRGRIAFAIFMAVALFFLLTEHIERLHRQIGTVEGTPSAEVGAFRRWLGEETARQLAGAEPTSYPPDEP